MSRRLIVEPLASLLVNHLHILDIADFHVELEAYGVVIAQALIHARATQPLPRIPSSTDIAGSTSQYDPTWNSISRPTANPSDT